MRRASTAVSAGLLLALALGAAPAYADTDPAPAFSNVSVPLFANAHQRVTGTVTPASGYIKELQFVIIDESTGTPATVADKKFTSGSGAVAFDQTLDVSDYADAKRLDLSITATDSSGNSSTSTQDFTIDRVNPTITVNQYLPSQFGSTILDGFTPADNNQIVSTTCQLDSGPVAPCGTQEAASSVSYSGVAPGQHQVTITATDVAGNSFFRVLVTQVMQQNSSVGAAIFTARQEAGKSADVFVGVSTSYPQLPATGTVTVSEGGKVLGTGTLGPTTKAKNAAGGSVTGADVVIPAVKAGTHTLTITYGGDLETLPSAADFTFSAVKPAAATVKSNKIVKKKVQLTLACAKGTYGCTGTATLGKSKAKYAIDPGHTKTVTLALPAGDGKGDKVKVVLNDTRKRTVSVKLK